MPAQGKTAARGYGSAHARQRERLRQIVIMGGAVCSRCGRAIAAGALWDLDHTEDREGYAGPAHRACNRAAGGRKAGRNKRARRRRIIALSTSRAW